MDSFWHFYYPVSKYAYRAFMIIGVFCMVSVMTQCFNGPMDVFTFAKNVMTICVGTIFWCLLIRFVDHTYHKFTTSASLKEALSFRNNHR